MIYDIVLLEGDGIGPEITEAVKEIFKAANVDVKWHPHLAGSAAYEKGLGLLPNETIDAIKKYKVALKGPITTPIGTGFRSINVSLRLAFNLYSNVRPSRSYENISKFKNIDIVMIRENTEDLYIGKEKEVEDGYEAAKLITKTASTKIIRYAFEYAIKHNRKKVTCVHKANILKKTDGLFLELFNEISKEYPTIQKEDKIIDNMCMQLVMKPELYDVIVAPNLYGDILSDLIAGLVGGLGLVPGANIGDEYAIFEAVHGSAPDIAGKNIANPTAMLLSAVLMLEYLGETEKAKLITNAINKTLNQNNNLTPDLGGIADTKIFTKQIISNL